MSAPDTVTVLRSVDGAVLTKRITRRQGGGFDIEPYDRSFWYSVERVPVDGIVSVGRLIARLENDPRACIIRGRPKPGTNLERTRRLIYDHVEDDGSMTPATFEAEATRLVAIDVDSLECPEWCPEALARRRKAIERDPAQQHTPAAFLDDNGEGACSLPNDGDPDPIDPVHDPEICLRAIYNLLPGEFRDTTCYYQQTSGAGIKPGVRMRLWFWCERSVSDAEAKRWLGGCVVDTSLYSPVQPHYVARPIFRPPSLDPVRQRLGFFWRHAAAVPLPELPEPASSPTTEPRERKPVVHISDHRKVALHCLARADLTDWEREFCTKIANLDEITPKQAKILAKIADPVLARAEAYAEACISNIRRAPPGAA